VKRYLKGLCLLLALGGWVAIAAPAKAGPIYDGTGSPTTPIYKYNPATPLVPPVLQGNDYVTYAVINTGTAGGQAELATLFGSSNVKTMFGSASAANQQFLYLYEVVNKSGVALGSYSLQINSSVVGAAGEISNVAGTAGSVFKNTNGSLVGPTTNTWSGPASSTPAATDFGATSPTTFLSSLTGTTSQLLYQFQPDLLPSPGSTTILWATSANGPTTSAEVIQDTKYIGGANVLTPAATPEPTSMAMMGLGVFGLGGWAGWRRRFRKLP